MNEQIQEIRYQVGEAWKGTYNAATSYGNAAVVQDPTGLSVYRSLKPGNAGHPLTDTSWWFRIIDLSSIKQEADHLQEIDTEMTENESARVAAEAQRVSRENARINAENARIQAEQTRASQETARIQAEQTRASQETARIQTEQTRASQETARIQAEQTRASQEQARVNAETRRQTNEENRVSAEQYRVESEINRIQNEQSRLLQAEADHQTAVQDNAQMTELVERADADHVQAAEDHTTAVSDHNTATSDHTQASNDHATAASDHEIATSDHTASAAATAAANEAAGHANAMEERLLSGEVVPALAKAAISLGNGICSTDTYTKDKVVTIPNFMLLSSGTINVLFTTPINTEETTLNVSNTGAKPVHILGQSLPAGVVKAQTYATLIYDGTAWNIVNLFCPDAQFDPAGLLVDMGMPSGVKWAARDIDLTKPGGFCETPFTYMKSFFSWGNIDGHNPISNSAFDYNWGGVNETEPYYEGQPYGDTPGKTLTGNIAVGEDFDAARANLGAPWRMPTNGEFAELFANIIYIDANGDEVDTTKADKRVTVNGVMGLYIQSKLNGARLFFSCSGSGAGRSWNFRGANGYYWSSTWYSARNARGLSFVSGGVYPQINNYRYSGFALRPVQ